jgi:hypothetical protein
MPPILNLDPNAKAAPAPLRRPKVDFDQNGQKSSLQELLSLGGIFPLARIQDRLPLSRYILGAMAEAWKGEPSEWLFRGQENGRRITILIHLDRFTEALNAHVETASETSSPVPLEVCPNIEESPETLLMGGHALYLHGFPALA